MLVTFTSKAAHTWCARSQFGMGDNKCTCWRLTAVVGDVEGNKVNDVVFCGDVSEVPEANVLFFGGDVQVRNLFW